MLARKLLFTLTIVVLANKISCQYDDPGKYRGDDSDDDDEDHSSYSDDSGNESDHPDYSRYYNNENKAPLSVPYTGGGGFVSPIEFQSFFPPGGFGFAASSKQEVLKPAKDEQNSGFVRSDEFKNAFTPSDDFSTTYFEKAASEIPNKPTVKNANFVTKPSYYGDEDDDNSEVQDLNKKPTKNSNKYYKTKSPPPKQSAKYKANKFSGYRGNPPHAPQHSNSKYTQTPYQKYSFQTNAYASPGPYNPAYSKYSDTGYAGIPSYDFQPTELISQKIQAKDCTKIEKPITSKGPNGRLKREAMQCYICKDPKSGANFEQCSYASQPTPLQESYSEGSIQKFSSTNGNRYRYKRYTQRNKKEKEDIVDVADHDPYEYVKSSSAPYNTKSEDGKNDEEKDDYYKSEYDDYRFGPEFFDNLDSTKEEKSSSEIRSEKLVKDTESCKKVKKGSSTCVVCKDLKTGDNYEQCSYTSEPNEKKYAYVKEKKYNSNDDPGYGSENEEESDSTQTKPVYKEERKTKTKKPKRKPTARRPSSKKVQNKNSKPSYSPSDDPYNQPDYYTQPKGDYNGRVIDKRQNKKPQEEDEQIRKEDEYYFPEYLEDGVHPQKQEGKTDFETEIDDYHYKLHHPEYDPNESKNEETRVSNPYFDDDGNNKKDVDDVLAEFAKKDRSDCQRVEKQGMTCFLCTDQKGLQNEECMFVSESRPQGSHLAYHEVKEYKTPEKAAIESESKIIKAVAQNDQKRRKVLPKKVVTTETVRRTVDTTTLTPATKTVYTVRPRKRPTTTAPTTTSSQEPQTSESRNYENKKKAKKVNEPDPTIKTPKEFDVYGTDGAFSSETKPVYSKKLGFTLPKFMIEKSEEELEFDAFQKSGS